VQGEICSLKRWTPLATYASTRKALQPPFLTHVLIVAVLTPKCRAATLNWDQDPVALRSLALQVDVPCPAEALKAEACQQPMLE